MYAHGDVTWVSLPDEIYLRNVTWEILPGSVYLMILHGNVT